jgi:hypothetical protein
MNWALNEDSRSYTSRDAIKEYNRKHKPSNMQPKCCIPVDERQPNWDAMMSMIAR